MELAVTEHIKEKKELEPRKVIYASQVLMKLPRKFDVTRNNSRMQLR